MAAPRGRQNVLLAGHQELRTKIRFKSNSVSVYFVRNKWKFLTWCFDFVFSYICWKFEKNKTCSTTTTRCRWKLSGAQLGAWTKLFPEGVNFPHFWPGILDLNSDFDIFHNSKWDNTFLKYMQSYRHVNFWHPFKSMSKKAKFCLFSEEKIK